MESSNILKITHHDQVGFIPRMQGFSNNHKAIDMMHHIKKQKDKKPFISRDAEKSFDKIQHQFLKTKTNKQKTPLQKAGIEGIYLNTIKAIYDKTTENIILNDKILKAFPLKSGTRPECPISALLFYSFESPSQRNQRRKIKGIQIGKEVKLSLFADDMIFYIENLRDTTRKLNMVNLEDIKSIHRNSMHSYTLTMKKQKMKLRKHSHSPLQ